MTDEELRTKKSCFRKLVDLEFERVRRATLQENKDLSAVFTAKSKVVELMEEICALDGALQSSTAST